MLTTHPTIRKIIYGASIAAQIAAVFIALTSPELAAAFTTTAGILAGVAGATALSNITRDVYSEGLGGIAPEIDQ